MRAPADSATATIEPSTNRPGRDYISFDLPDSDHLACRAACLDQEQCLAWTYVQPGVQGPYARCWLKSEVPPAYPNQCCVSGVK